MIRLLLGFLLLLPVAGFAASSPTTHEYQLNNGLQVLIREDRRAPVAVVMIWYRVGSMDEPPGKTGISHMLEHMLFKNTKHLSPGDFSQWVARFGGRSNAFTFYDYTGYFQQYEASRLPLALELEAERMANLRIDPEEFTREVQVVMEERRQRVDDNPNGLAWEHFASLARPGTGYAHPIIGWRHEIAGYDPQQAMDWYRQWYSPGNATLVIVGDVDVAETRQLIDRFFGLIPARELPVRAAPVMLDNQGERRVTLSLPVQVPVVLKAWNVPSLSTAEDARDFHILTMLAGVLDGGESARFQARLVREQQLASHAGANYQGTSRGDGLLVLSGAPVPGTSAQQLEAAFDAEVQRLLSEPPSDAELQRVRARVLASQVYDQDSLMGQAMRLGQLAMLGQSPDFSERHAAALADVTAEDVQAAVRRWLVPARSVTAHVLPVDDEGAQ